MTEVKKVKEPVVETPTEKVESSKKLNRAWWLLLVAVLLAAASGYGVYRWQQQKVKDLNQQVSQLKKPAVVVTAPTKAADPYTGWGTYCSHIEAACFRFPNDWK